jgi:hypothetical protein
MAFAPYSLLEIDTAEFVQLDWRESQTVAVEHDSATFTANQIHFAHLCLAHFALPVSSFFLASKNALPDRLCEHPRMRAVGIP